MSDLRTRVTANLAKDEAILALPGDSSLTSLVKAGGKDIADHFRELLPELDAFTIAAALNELVSFQIMYVKTAYSTGLLDIPQLEGMTAFSMVVSHAASLILAEANKEASTS